jgi:hypothetical protein
MPKGRIKDNDGENCRLGYRQEHYLKSLGIKERAAAFG